MRKHPILIMLAATALVAGLVPVGSADAGHTVKITATAQGSDQCPDGDTWCWDVTKDGTLDPGAEVEVTVEVPDEEGQTTHNLYVADSGYDEGGNTGTSAAINGTSESIGPGETTTFTFTVPDDASELYFWCDEGAHEMLGMYWTESVASASDGHDHGDHQHDDGHTDDTGGSDQQSSPGLGLVAALAGLALVAFLGKRLE